MARKSFNEKLQDSKDMPKIVVVDNDKSIERYGGENMLIAPPIEYSELMGEIPLGKLTTTRDIREFLAQKHEADFTCPMTAGIFISLAAQASCERDFDRIPFWRTLKTDGSSTQNIPAESSIRRQSLKPRVMRSTPGEGKISDIS